MRQGEPAPGSDQLYRSAFEAAPVGMLIAPLDGAMLVNGAFAQLLGYSAPELRGVRWRDITHPDDVAQGEEVIASLLAGTVASSRRQHRYVHKTGAIVWTEASTTLARDTEGKPSFLVTSVLDVTSHRQAGMEVLFQNVLLRTLQETLPDGVLVVDAENRVLTHNRRFLEICGVPEEVAAPGSDERLLAHATTQVTDPKGFLDRISWLHQNPHATSHEEIDLADGRTLDRYSTCLLAPDGKRLGRVYFFRDITERKRDEVMLHSQLDELQRWQDVILDREDRLAALKREVNELCGRLDEPARYASQTPASGDGDLQTTAGLPCYADGNPGRGSDEGK